MSSQAEPPLTLSSFPQTGSWNMLDLSKLPVQATLAILSRYNAARVSPYTALVGELLCGNFQLTAKGRRNLELAVNNLKVVGSLGDTLEFGFGIEDVIRSMAKSERGCICLALCAALKECYSEDMAVEVLLEMALLAKVDGKHMPSNSSWKELLNACTGTLSASKFPLMAEHFMQINNEEESLGAYHRIEGLPKSYRTCSSPKSIAEALIALSHISKNELESVTLIGGADVGWLAATAVWILDLRISIIGSDGVVFYTNCESTKSVQVRIIHQGMDVSAPNLVQTMGKAYFLEDVSGLFESEGRSPSAAVVSGRVEWKGILSSTFLADFKKLMGIPRAFGGLLGSAARLFKALSLADSSIPERYRLACTSYCDASYGPGFVTNVLRWFPELQALKDSMQEAASVDLDTSRRTYEACLSTIRSHCDCKTCRSSTCHPQDEEDSEMTPAPEEVQENAESPDNSEFGSYSEDAESVDDWDPDRFCEVIMAETIIYISRALSNVVLEDKYLYPMRKGLELAYGRQLNQRRSMNSGRRAIKEIGPIAFCLDFDSNFSIGLQRGSENVEIRLHTVLELFSGAEAPSTSSQVSALSINGVCAFLGVLKEPTEDRNSVARIHVIPGKIIHETKNYPRLVDRVVDPVNDVDYSSAVRLLTSLNSSFKTSLIVRESSSALECVLQVKVITAEELNPIRVGPSQLAVLLASRRGLISCGQTTKIVRIPGSRCGTERGNKKHIKNLEKSMDRGVPLDINGKSVLVLECRETNSTVASIASTAYLSPQYSTYLIDRECLDCCLKAILAIDRPERSHFCIFKLST